MELKINGMVKKVKHISHLSQEPYNHQPDCIITCEDGTVYRSGHTICAAIELGKEVIHTNVNGHITNRIKYED